MLDSPETRKAAQYLRLDATAHRMSVVLVPAPDPQHEGHMIRVVAERPPRWYLDIAASWGYKSKRQGRFERLHFLYMLRKIENGERCRQKSPYWDAACNIVERTIEVPEEVFCT